MSISQCLHALEEAKKELEKEKQFHDDEKKMLSDMITRAAEAIENQWGK